VSHTASQNDRRAAAALTAVTLLWRRRKLVVRCIAGSFVLSALLVFLIPGEYTAAVDLMPPGWQSSENPLAAPSSALSMAPAAGGLANGILGGRSPAGPLIGIIHSRTAQDDLVARFHLQRVYRVRRIDDARAILARRTSASEDKPTGIVSIVVTDRDPTRARDLAAAYVDELNRLVVSMDTSAAHRERVFLEQRVAEVQDELHDAELRLSSFSSRTGTMDGEDQSKVMLDATSRLQGQLIAADSDLHGLEAIYSTGNARVQQAQARVATLHAELRRMGGVGNAADADSIYPSLRQLPVLGVTWADLYRRTRTLEVALDLLNRDLETARIEEAEQIPSVKLLDPPAIPERRSFPPRLLLIVLGTGLGLLLAGAWVLGCEVWRRTEEADPWKRLAREVADAWPRRVRRA
jgi:capsule polysaccharide export protein KpsE/RkpR